MIKFVQHPNLPENCSGLIICGRYYDIFKNKLEMLGIRAFLMPDSRDLPREISYHADLSVFHAGDNRLFAAKDFAGTDFFEIITSAGFEVTFFENEQSFEYPGDAAGNVCLFGKFSIFNSCTADKARKKYLDSIEAVRIDVKQGYTKCNVCVVDDHSIITNDRMIAEKAETAGIDALLSDPSYIKLEGFSHGFIGGCAFKTASDNLCFTGILDTFPDEERNRILEFLDKKGIEPVFLTDRPLFDIGGAVPVLER